MLKILVGIEAVFLYEITQGKIRRRAEASDADCFPLQVRHTFDFRQSHHVKRRHVGDAADEGKIGGAKTSRRLKRLW